MMASGIYVIEAPSGATYVGSAVNMDQRRREHFSAMRRGCHRNSRLQRGYAKHGEALKFRPILICRPEDLLLFEQRAINALSPGYNICLVAGNSLGVKRSEEYRAKKAEQARGRKDSPETRAKKSASLMGRPVSQETRQKHAARRDWKHSEETKAKMRGRERSPEHRAKLGAAAVGRQARLGKTHTAETKQKISDALRGRQLPQTTRDKIKAAHQRRRSMSVDYEVTVTFKGRPK